MKTKSELRFVAAAAGFSLTVLVAAQAMALPDFTNKIADAVSTPCEPRCTLCHIDDSGGQGTLVQPMLSTLYEHFWDGRGDGLKAALDSMKADGADSDNDGVGDVAELEQGRDPNLAGEGDLCGPAMGCGAHVEPRPDVDGWAGLLSGLTAVVLLWRARRRQ